MPLKGCNPVVFLTTPYFVKGLHCVMCYVYLTQTSIPIRLIQIYMNALTPESYISMPLILYATQKPVCSLSVRRNCIFQSPRHVLFTCIFIFKCTAGKDFTLVCGRCCGNKYFIQASNCILWPGAPYETMPH